MAVAIQESASGNYLEVSLSGKLSKEDYEHFVPVVEKAIQAKGKVKILVQMHDFHGWSAGALWEDLKFDWKHLRDIDRLALVGESKWEAGMAVFCKPFTGATIKYFDQSKLDEARQWIDS